MHTDADLYLRGTETLLDRGLAARERAEALDAMAAAYADAGITRYAAWAHESDRPLIAELERRGHRLQEWTRVMGMALADLRPDRPAVAVKAVDWPAYLRLEGLPPGFLAAADHAALQVLGARVDGELAAAALAYDHAGDCGIFNVGTRQRYRRRGLAGALTLVQLHDAVARGCVTASLQSIPDGRTGLRGGGYAGSWPHIRVRATGVAVAVPGTTVTAVG
jgi:ribosomal protein S18 acetylase RimI-like enzyme